MHLDDERVQRLLHGELEPAGERLARQHLTACDHCRTLVDEARAEEHRLFGLLREVDHPPPDAEPLAILAAGRSPASRWQRWAAGIVLVAAAAGAAYAAPGSPLPAALDRLVTILAPTEPRTAVDSAAADTAAPGAGIAVTPGDRLTIRFLVEGDGALATLSLTDDDEAMVRAMTGAATFSSDVDRLSVRSAGPARFEILIPRSAPWVEVLAGDTPVFRKRAAKVVTETEPGPDGRYGLRLSRSAR
jgi:anti-sigma factor ChrR (cupin superfamily)